MEKQQPNFEVLVSQSGGLLVVVVDLKKKKETKKNGPCICWP